MVNMERVRGLFTIHKYIIKMAEWGGQKVHIGSNQLPICTRMGVTVVCKP